MVRVESKEAVVCLDEQTVKELQLAIEVAKSGAIKFIDEPIPLEDMSPEQYKVEKMRRGFITVSSPNSGVSFQITLNVPRSWDQNEREEPLNYRLDEGN